jgi:VanZ family protein
VTSLRESCDNGNDWCQAVLPESQGDVTGFFWTCALARIRRNHIARLRSFLNKHWHPISTLTRRSLRTAFYLMGALVGILSLAPAATLPPTSIGDKAEHVLAYALLGFLGGVSSERGVLRTFLGLSAFGIAIEMLQTFSPGRSPDALDLLADIVGAALGCGAALALRPMILRERIAGQPIDSAGRSRGGKE